MKLNFISTMGAMGALQTALQALTVTIDGNPAPAFEKVAIFDMSNLVVALQELVTYANRVCLIVHDREHFETEKKGNELYVRQRREVALLIADRHYANRQIALQGDANKTPGAYNLKDLILNTQIGLLMPGIYVEPVEGEQMVLEQKVRDQLQGRVAFSLGLRLVGGNVIVYLGSQPIP